MTADVIPFDRATSQAVQATAEVSIPSFVPDDGLRQALGRDADAAVGVVNDVLAIAPPRVASKLQASGIFRDAEIVQWLMETMLADDDPLGGVADIEAEIRKIEHVMRVDRRRYYADERMQARYRSLLASRSL